MLGAIIGDIVGSIYEFNNIKTKDFEFLHKECFFTDDTVMTVAITKALSETNIRFTNLEEKTIYYMQQFGRKYPFCSYGGNFEHWIYSNNPEPYNSWGNGAAMRVSACGFFAETLDMAIMLAQKVTRVTHNHPEGIKGAEATAVAIYLAQNGKSKEEIKEYINDNYYKIDFTLDKIRDKYKFDESCQGTVPYALEAFFESTDFEDAIRNAISIGGDSDTIAAITGAIAEAYYGITLKLRNKILNDYLPDDLKTIILRFEKIVPTKIIYEDNELLIENLKKIREACPKTYKFGPVDQMFKNGWNEAFNYVFSLLESTENVLCDQGYHHEAYTKSIKRILRQSK
jgi:type I restriction enzyme M protein